MARRQRKAIRKDEYLAAALACLLPETVRTVMRNAQLPAKSIIGMFSPDHIVLHALDGSDKWWNLHPTLRAAHKEKSKRDTAIVAKVKRLQKRPLGELVGGWAIRQRAAKQNASAKLKSPWRGKRRIPSRPFPKAHRPFRRPQPSAP